MHDNDVRPSAASEVRAWITFAIVIVAHTIGMTWWAATLSAEVHSLREILLRDHEVHNDHEARIRALERVSRAPSPQEIPK